VGIGIGPPVTTTIPPPPTTAPPQPVVGGLECSGGVDLREDVDASDAHVCTTEGSPLPYVAVIDGKLPNGVTLRRYPDAKGSWLVLSGTPTEHGKFTVRVAATTPGHRSEAAFEVNVAADQTGEITSYHQGEDTRATHATRGPDGAMWYTNQFGNRIGRIDRNGSILDPRSGPGVDHPYDITGGPDNEIWFTNAGGNSIGRFDSKNFKFFTGEGISEPHGITTGPDGALWFTNMRNDSIGRVTTDGKVTTYRSDGNIGDPEDIVTGPDGALWFSIMDYPQIGRITPKGAMTFFPLPHPAERLTVGPDGALWFTTSGDSVGRITVDGKVTTFKDKDLTRSRDIVTGPDGALWITNDDSAHPGVLRLTTDGSFTRYFDLNATHTPDSIVVGQDQAIWFTNSAIPTIGRIRTSVSTSEPNASTDAGPSAETGTAGPPDPSSADAPATTTTIAAGPDARCAVTVENRTGADRDVRVADATKGGGDRWDPQPETDATVGAGAAESWATVDVAPGACRTDARLVLPRDGADVTWKLSVTHGGGADDQTTCTTSNDDYPCQIETSPGAGAGDLDVLVRLSRRG
jgi:virginiamycin B lyase